MKIWIIGLLLLVSVGFVSSYNGDFCNETHSPCGGGCTSTDLSAMYESYDFITDSLGVGNISGWNTSCITSMGNSDYYGIFTFSNFNQDISGWDVSNVINMYGMFGVSSFNQDISGWNTSSVTDMTLMFSNNIVFNQDISGWDVSNVINMEAMFSGSSSFNQNLSGWCVDNILSLPTDFDNSASSWVLERPIWGTCGGVPSCVENWTLDEASCDGLISNFTVSYSDVNTCGTFVDLPVDNGTLELCCVESWSPLFSGSCSGQDKVKFYVDANVCGTSFVVPVDNGSVVLCDVSSGGGGGSVIVSQSIIPSVDTVSSVESTSFFGNFINSIIDWFAGLFS